MEFEEAKAKFIHTWGALGSQWGINRTMAQLHALLLISPEPLSTEEVMEELSISRGNANMNLRALLEWKLIDKVHKPGERREYFGAEKDMWKMTSRVAAERRKRELQPVLETLATLEQIDGDPNKREEIKEFKAVTKSLADITSKLDQLMDKATRADQHWFGKSMLKVLKL